MLCVTGTIQVLGGLCGPVLSGWGVRQLAAALRRWRSCLV